MNNRERVLAVLNHEQPDKIPYNIGFTQRARAKMVEFYGEPDFVSKLGNCLTNLSCEPKDSWKEVNPDIWEDQFGVQWNRSIDKDIGNVCNCLVTSESVNEYEFPDPDDQSRYEVKQLLNVVGESGGYIASPAHAIPGDAKPENIAAMIEVLRNQ